MLRQNRSEGSSTSRSFAKTALLRARRKTFQFSDEQFARHIFLYGTTFPHPLCSDRGPGVRLHQRCDTFFEGTTFPYAARPSPFAERQPGKSGSQGDRGDSFRGNHFSSFLP